MATPARIKQQQPRDERAHERRPPMAWSCTQTKEVADGTWRHGHEQARLEPACVPTRACRACLLVSEVCAYFRFRVDAPRRACRAVEGVPWLSPLTLCRDPLFSDAHAQSQSPLHIKITCKLRYLLCDHTTSARHRRSTLRDAAATARKRCRNPCTPSSTCRGVESGERPSMLTALYGYCITANCKAAPSLLRHPFEHLLQYTYYGHTNTR